MFFSLTEGINNELTVITPPACHFPTIRHASMQTARQNELFEDILPVFTEKKNCLAVSLLIWLENLSTLWLFYCLGRKNPENSESLPPLTGLPAVCRGSLSLSWCQLFNICIFTFYSPSRLRVLLYSYVTVLSWQLVGEKGWFTMKAIEEQKT